VTEATPDLISLREPCADFVTASIYDRFADELQRFGERGKKVCHQDILYHLDYLQGALISNDPEIFSQYALWLRDVLNSRGVPTAHLSASFDFLEVFFNSHLSDTEAGEIAHILKSATRLLSSDAPPITYGQLRFPEHSQVSDYRTSILQGQHRTALALVTNIMKSGSSLTQASVQLIQPALYQVGTLWQNNQATVSQEHLATAISQNVLASAYMYAKFSDPIGKTAMFACVEGNYHSVGLHILSDGFETIGWDVLNLGANVPMQDLIVEVNTRRPELLALSISLPGQLATARSVIEMLRSEMGNACPEIWIGGLGTAEAWRITKADGWASDALHALEQLR